MGARVRRRLVEPDPGHRPRRRRRELDPQIHRAGVARIDDRRGSREVEDRVLRRDRRRRSRRRGVPAARDRGHGEGVARPVRQVADHGRRRRRAAHLHRRLRCRADIRGDRVAADRRPSRCRRIRPTHQHLPARRRRGHIRRRLDRGRRRRRWREEDIDPVVVGVICAGWEGVARAVGVDAIRARRVADRRQRPVDHAGGQPLQRGGVVAVGRQVARDVRRSGRHRDRAGEQHRLPSRRRSRW